MRLRLLSLALCAAASTASAQVPTFDDVIVGQVPLDAGGTVPLFTDIYLPSGSSGPTPCVVWIHGGGWASGSHDGMPTAILRLLDSGVALASAGYRLSDQAIFPAQLHDVKGVIRHLRANAAQYNIDPTLIAAWGASAGGHLAALLATTADESGFEGDSGGNTQHSSRIVAAVDYFGPTDLLMANPDITYPPGSYLDHDAPSSYMSHLIGFDGPGQGIGVLRGNLFSTTSPFPEKLELAREANPITHLSQFDAPIFIAHGLLDTIIPVGQSRRLHQASIAAGCESVLKIDPISGHGSLSSSTYAASRAFLLSHFESGSQAAGVAYCFGDLSSAACPCGNYSAANAYEGCANSSSLGGRLRALGSTSLANETVTLVASRMTGSTSIYIGSLGMESDGAGAALSDGLRCISGTIVRYGTKANTGGASQYPNAGDLHLSLVGGIAPGTTHYFQALYRDNFEFCRELSFNLTNGVAVTFRP